MRFVSYKYWKIITKINAMISGPPATILAPAYTEAVGIKSISSIILFTTSRQSQCNKSEALIFSGLEKRVQNKINTETTNTIHIYVISVDQVGYTSSNYSFALKIN